MALPADIWPKAAPAASRASQLVCPPSKQFHQPKECFFSSPQHRELNSAGLVRGRLTAHRAIQPASHRVSQPASQPAAATSSAHQQASGVESESAPRHSTQAAGQASQRVSQSVSQPAGRRRRSSSRSANPFTQPARRRASQPVRQPVGKEAEGGKELERPLAPASFVFSGPVGAKRAHLRAREQAN